MTEKTGKEKTAKAVGKRKVKDAKKELAEKEPIKKGVKKDVNQSKTKEKIKLPEMKLFGKWDSDVEIVDPGLRRYVNVSPRMLPRSAGTKRERFHKSKIHILERLALNLMVSGHRGKKHRISSGRFGGSLYTTLKHIEHAFDIIEKKENKNPLQVFATALENTAIREEIVSFQVGSIVAREAVVTAPQRRIDKTLRFMSQGAYRKSFRSKRTLAASLAEEISAAYHKSNQSAALGEKERIEREALGSR